MVVGKELHDREDGTMGAPQCTRFDSHVVPNNQTCREGLAVEAESRAFP